MKLFASVYIGSFEIVMKVFQGTNKKQVKEIDCIKMSTELVYDVHQSGKIKKETIDRMCSVLYDMKQTMDMYQVDGYKVYAGSTFNSADNKIFVLEQIRLRSKLEVTSLSNSEHRFLSYRAATTLEGFEEIIADSAAIIDVGGASVQITLFSQGKVITTQHLKLGSATLGENIKKLWNTWNPMDQLLEMMYKELDVFCKMFLQDQKITHVMILGEHVSNLAERIQKNKTQGSISYEEYLEFLDRFSQKNMQQTIESTGLGNQTKEFLQGFYLLHQAIADKIVSKNVYLPGVSVVEGMAYEYFSDIRYMKQTHDFHQDIISAAWSIAKRYDSYHPHLKTLEYLSTTIFDTLSHFHGMETRCRLLMQVIAILHDCGKYISLFEASNCSYAIIMASEILGLSHKEREMIALTVEMNRKPRYEFEELADRFDENEYMNMMKMLAILKVANALDRSHKQKVKQVKMSLKNGELIISMETKDSLALEKELFQDKADFFEDVFSIRPVLREKKIRI